MPQAKIVLEKVSKKTAVWPENDIVRVRPVWPYRQTHSARAYHAGLPAAERSTVQSLFMRGRLRIVVATVAFGMGLDKANVRGVVHVGMPAGFQAGAPAPMKSCEVFFSSFVERKKSHRNRGNSAQSRILLHAILMGGGRLFVRDQACLAPLRTTSRRWGAQAATASPPRAAPSLRLPRTRAPNSNPDANSNRQARRVPRPVRLQGRAPHPRALPELGHRRAADHGGARVPC